MPSFHCFHRSCHAASLALIAVGLSFATLVAHAQGPKETKVDHGQVVKQIHQAPTFETKYGTAQAALFCAGLYPKWNSGETPAIDANHFAKLAKNRADPWEPHPALNHVQVVDMPVRAPGRNGPAMCKYLQDPVVRQWYINHMRVTYRERGQPEDRLGKR